MSTDSRSLECRLVGVSKSVCAGVCSGPTLFSRDVSLLEDHKFLLLDFLGQGGLRRARTRRPGQLRGPPSFHLFTGQPKDECINNAIYLYVPYLDEIEKILAAVPDELMYSKPTFKRVNRGAETMREYPQSKWHELFDTAKYDHLRMATGTDTACTSKHI
ncbi:hypothetical protein PF011_g24042 [Phytophthora fragariae]|uniref:Uncharacterized protein n=1 Tax=Phytophthora fragariae TaxID=53985 RepID=A0A6A3I2Q8_9STRA|nr:hypothetical protein PF011_g24042 [Phytophthora fragariae]